jgi:hypothetical protein
VTKSPDETLNSDGNTGKNKYQRRSGRRVTPQHPRACTVRFPKEKKFVGMDENWWSCLPSSTPRIKTAQIEGQTRTNAARWANGNFYRNRGLLKSAWPTHTCRSTGGGRARPWDRRWTAGGPRGRTTPKESTALNQILQTDPQILPPVNVLRFSSAYSLLCFAMVSSKDGVKKA